jgi:hypothetical protein
VEGLEPVEGVEIRDRPAVEVVLGEGLVMERRMSSQRV